MSHTFIDPASGHAYAVDPFTGVSYWVDGVAVEVSPVPAGDPRVVLPAIERPAREPGRGAVGTVVGLLVAALVLAAAVAAHGLAGPVARGVDAAASSARSAAPAAPRVDGGPGRAAPGLASVASVTRFGSVATLADGSTLTCDRPVPFRRSRVALGGDGARSFLKSRCTFTNRSGEAFEPAGTTSVMWAGGVRGDAVQQRGLLAPVRPVAPGRSVSWWTGHGLPSTSTAGVRLTVTLGAARRLPVTFG